MGLESLAWEPDAARRDGHPRRDAPRDPVARPRSTAMASATSPASRSRATWATSTRRSSGRPASRPARASAPTAPAVSCSCTPAIARSTREHGLITTVAARLGDAPATYALEGSVAVAGSLIGWLRDNLGIIGDAVRGRGARPVRARQRRRRLRAGVLGPVRAALAERRPRHHRRPDRVRVARQHRPGRARIDRLPGLRPRRGDGRRPRRGHSPASCAWTAG